MGRKMKIATVFVAVILSCALAEGNILRHRRTPDDLQQSYIVHYNQKGQALSVAGFDDFVRALNRQQGIPELTVSSYAESPVFPVLQANPSTSGLTTTTEPTTPHQPRPLATGTSRTPASIVIAAESPKPTYVTVGSTASPLKLPHEMSGTTPMAEVSVSTDKPALTLALGHDPAPIPGNQGGSSSSDVSNLVTPGENSPSKMTVSGLGFPHGTGLTSKVISLQQPPLLNYAQPSVALHSYLPGQQTSYLHTVPTTYQRTTSAHYAQPETFNYASYPNQNLAIDNNVPLHIVRREPSLIDIGQGLGHGYRSTQQGTPVNLGGWGGVDYGHHRSIPVAKPVLSTSKFGYTGPPSSRGFSKITRGFDRGPHIGFGIGSW